MQSGKWEINLFLFTEKCTYFFQTGPAGGAKEGFTSFSADLGNIILKQ